MRDFAIKVAGDASEREIADLNRSIRYIQSCLCGSANPTSCLIGFVIELAWHQANDRYNVHAILDEIAILEGRSKRRSATKPARKFRRPPLKGLWHKHHFQTRFMVENILLEINKPGAIESMFERFIGQQVGDVIGEMAAEVVDGSLARRAKGKGLTGEFIVFEQDSNGVNHFLTLGTHGEYDEISKRIEYYKSLDRKAHTVQANLGSAPISDQ